MIFKKKTRQFLYSQERQKSHLKVNFIVVGLFYFSANINKVGYTYYMSEESNIRIISLWLWCASIIMIIREGGGKKIFKRNKEAYFEGSA